eukprot:UN02333
MSTVQALITFFKTRADASCKGCVTQPIDHIDTDRGIPGVFMGRYPNDLYNGLVNDVGNPWILCTQALAEYYYRHAEKVLMTDRNRLNKTRRAHYKWLLGKEESDPLILASSFLQMGDDQLNRIRT